MNISAGSEKERGEHLLNIPNTLTITRIVIIPLFVTAVIYGRLRHALYLFVLASVTDILDGLLARLTGQQTRLGTFLDPLADKFLLVTSFVLFSVYGWIPKWLTITVISRDLIVVVGWLLLTLIYNKSKVEPVFLGKAAIASQLALLAYVLLSVTEPSLPPVPTGFIIITASLTAVSGIQYLYRGLRQAHGG
ncbi:MAG: CDP-alcohol phosphatidyltransferase family protein [Nitrospiraceae bacterium]|nr:CDP-alcohol phosphatidyltransferase family protein [Nitrospiraceae bacterium]